MSADYQPVTPDDWQPLNDTRSKFGCGDYKIARRDDGTWEAVNTVWFNENTKLPCWSWDHPATNEATALAAASRALTKHLCGC